MKIAVWLLIGCFMISCGSSRQVTQAPTESNTETAAVIPTPEVPEIKRTHRPKETETAFVKKDTMLSEAMEDSMKEPEAIKEAESLFKTIALHKNWEELLQDHVTAAGNVNYKAFANNADFKAYLNVLSTNPPQENWTREDVLAYWINAYNAFTIQLIVDNYPIQSIKDIKTPWDHRFIKIGPKWYTLNDIEHKILRKMDEPRIHFAINCASVSCPRLLNAAFTPDTLDEQLTNVTRDFLNDETRNTISENQLRISKIFRWFGKDFKKNGSLIDFLNLYSEIPIADSAKVSFMDYDWNLNE